MGTKTNQKAWNVNKILYAVAIFMGIFMPCLIRLRMQYVMFGIELIYIIWKMISTPRIIIHNTPIKMLVTFIPFYLYYSFLVVSNAMTGGTSAPLYWIEYKQSLTIAAYIIVLAAVIMLYRQGHESSSSTFFQMITFVTAMQLVLVGLSFVLPGVKSFFNSLTIRNSYNEAIVIAMSKTWLLRWRAYGLAENLFDGFGFTTSILISIVFVYGLSTKKKGIIALAGVMLIMPLLNARSGLVLCLVSFMYIMFRYLNVKRVITFSLLIVVFVVCFILLFKYLPRELQNVLSGTIAEFTGLTQGEKKGVFIQIFGEDIVFPENVLLGAGISPERITGLAGIDSGYIQCLWRYGIIGTVLLWGGYISSAVIAYRRTTLKSNKVILVDIILIMVIYCFKLFLFNSYANNFLLFFILFYIGLEKEYKGNKVLQAYWRGILKKQTKITK